MNSKHSFCVATVLLVICCCCVNEKQYDVDERKACELVFQAVNGDETLTKTEVQSDGKSIWWSAHESINVFFGASESSKFTSLNDEPVQKARFKGTIEALTGETETGVSDSYWAVYPYDAENTCDGSSVTAVLPASQTAKAETFSDGQWMTIANSYGLALSFYAVGAGFRFSVTKEGVKSVTFRGNNNEVLAGKVRIGMDSNNRPVVLETITEEKEITLSAPEGGTLAVGTLYYISFFPTTFTQGFTITFNTEYETGTRIYPSSISFNRTDVHRGRDFDSSVEYTGIVPNNEIWYTTTDGTTISPKTVVGNSILSNEYKDKKGVICFEHNITSLPSSVFGEMKNLKSIVLPSSLTIIPEWAFYSCTNLESVVYSNVLTSISNYAFYECAKLSKIDVPTGLLSIGDQAFYLCSSLESISIPASVTSIGRMAFYSCTGLTSASINATINTIPECLFGICSKLLSVSLPTDVTSIKEGAFEDCSSLRSINIPPTVSTIEERVFNNCKALTSISLPDDLTSLGKNAFSWSGLTTIRIPSGLTEIKVDSFLGCSSLQSVSIPGNINTIGESAFNGCSSLTSLIINEGVSRIETAAFFNCRSLSDITLPSSITSLGDSVFLDCDELESVTIKAITVPTKGSLIFDSTSITNEFPIYVSIESLEAYKSAWEEYSARFFAIPPQAVDLGLSVKWASCNIGASVPNGYGSYYSWGETDTKSSYGWSRYKWSNGSPDTITKYNSNDYYGIVDNKIVLFSSDDVAHVKFGGKWRIPTSEDWDELIRNCIIEYKYMYGAYGWLVTSNKNGASIFLPFPGIKDGEYFNAAGYSGSYWSSSLYVDEPSKAKYVRFDYNGFQQSTLFRNCGISIRPVFGDYIKVSDIHLNKSELQLVVYGTETITATVLPENASLKALSWASSNSSIATVTSTGEVTAVAEGSTIITVSATDGSGVSADCEVTVTALPLPIPEAIDLGLSVKWASFNLGATSPEEIGDYYSWGETAPKAEYSWSTYAYGNSSNGPFSEYVTLDTYGIVDNKTTLDLDDDAANVQLGGNWRMPTIDEWKELRANCTRTSETLHGINVIKLTSTKAGYTDKYIYLSLGNYRDQNPQYGVGSLGDYWSSSLEPTRPSDGCCIGFFYSGGTPQAGNDYRFRGRTIRPVCD